MWFTNTLNLCFFRQHNVELYQNVLQQVEKQIYSNSSHILNGCRIKMQVFFFSLSVVALYSP